MYPPHKPVAAPLQKVKVNPPHKPVAVPLQKVKVNECFTQTSAFCNFHFPLDRSITHLFCENNMKEEEKISGQN